MRSEAQGRVCAISEELDCGHVGLEERSAGWKFMMGVLDSARHVAVLSICYGEVMIVVRRQN